MLLKVKFVNRLSNLINPNNLHITVKNVRINGTTRGCSGHITYMPTGRCVYIDTETSPLLRNKCLYRYAQDEKDFSSNHPGHSYPNLYAAEDDLAKQVARMLLKPNEKVNEHV